MRILIADDYEMLRRGVRSLLEAENSWEVCAEAVDGRDAVEKAHHYKPDVIVMDVSMPNMNGLDAARMIRQSLPETEILILTQHDTGEMIRHAFRAGAKGYVSKTAISQNLVNAVKIVGRHEFFWSDSPFPTADRIPPATNTQEILQREAALERASRESEERFRGTFEQAAVGMAHVSLNGYFIRTNEKLSEILGYNRGELLKFHFRDITHPGDVARSEEEFLKLVQGATTHFSIVKRYFHKNTAVLWATTTSSLVRDPQGAPSYLVTVIEDISERKRAETDFASSIAETVMKLELAQCALREKDEQLRIALVASHTGTIRWDPETGGLLEFGENAKALFGFAPDETITSIAKLMSRVHPEDLPIVTSAVERCRAGEDLELEGRVILNGGDVRWLYARGKSIRDVKGHPYIVGAVTDITKRKEAQEHAGTELREARDELEHRVDLRTRQLVQTLSVLEAEVKVRKEAEDKMRELSARLLRLQDDERRRIARDLHDTSGQTLSAIKMTSAALRKTTDANAKSQRLFDDLDALIEQALEEIRTTSHLLHPPLLDEIGLASAARWYVEGLTKRSRMEIDLNIRLSERIPSSLELALFRVLQESLTNIHRHSGSARAAIRCEQTNRSVVLAVRDYGNGMPAPVLERFRSTGMATGVGLAGMQERVRELGGKMEINSGAEGTTVTVTIPIPSSAKRVGAANSTAGTVRGAPFV